MNAREKLSLGLNDEVMWANPEKDSDAKPHKIVDILTPDKRLRDMTDVIIVQDAEFETFELYLSEVA